MRQIDRGRDVRRVSVQEEHPRRRRGGIDRHAPRKLPRGVWAGQVDLLEWQWRPPTRACASLEEPARFLRHQPNHRGAVADGGQHEQRRQDAQRTGSPARALRRSGPVYGGVFHIRGVSEREHPDDSTSDNGRPAARTPGVRRSVALGAPQGVYPLTNPMRRIQHTVKSLSRLPAPQPAKRRIPPHLPRQHRPRLRSCRSLPNASN